MLPDLGYEHVPHAKLLPPYALELERTLFGPRTELALEYARLNDVNRVEGARDAWLGIVCAGKGYYDLRHALRNLGLDERALERAGVRLLKLGMIWPLEPQIVREFADGLDEMLVIEEKRPFVETQLKELLYGAPDAPRIVGKRDEQGAQLLPVELDLDADLIARAVASALRAARRARLGRALTFAASTRSPLAADRCRWPAARRPSARRSSAPAARTTRRPRRRRERSSAAASAATRWSCSTPRARARSPA